VRAGLARFALRGWANVKEEEFEIIGKWRKRSVIYRLNGVDESLSHT
jgi:hypothetical protein